LQGKNQKMKYLFLLLVSGILVSCSSNDKTVSVDKDKLMKDTSSYTRIEWIDSTDQNLGKIDQGQMLEITWRFKNAGDKPLIIGTVRPGCGCTGAEGPTEPIAPGKEGTIKAKFDTKNYTGTQKKQVYVTANNSNRNTPESDVLNFSVDIIPKK
jgi:hypothetical protein